ncbi:MAG: hypothetical protein CVV57_04895 [Tenericutes bacterium HGW-Tenericutes-2]|jgi:uncharacterized membrane protein|nr:MAG: hypothetical protein CVV57_04895 [Tenericutes bacterium HGW-Tenericutes-2]
MNVRRINIYYILTTVYIITSIILGVILNNGLVIFLGWNILLATIVYLLAEAYVYLYKKKTKKLYLVIILIIYVLFFPNTLYVLTDFIHLENYNFFTNYPNIYEMMIKDWVVFMHITIGALYAAKLGIASIKKLELYILKYKIQYKILILSSLFLLSSLGIFIGRFLRFNSWQILDIFSIISGVFTHLGFALLFILIFFILHWVSYFVFSHEDKISL